ncbi:MAG: T9SS type A sorting domain-containing protein [Fidelibacterota bacterium]|nr:MAG: T9SS type A sorting domain-containing protein [Candidatus Neomarinimicrobiota bacterium]
MKYLAKGLLSVLVMIWICVGLVEKANAQDSDTLDVTPGFETLNLAIEGDTVVTGDDAGEPLNLNRVYRLERGGAYGLNGAVSNLTGHIFEGYPDSVGSVHLRIVAAEGDGPLPMLIPYADETGEADRVARLYGEGTFHDLYMTGIDNLGNQADKNMVRIEKKGGRYILDGCFLDYDAQSFVRMNSTDQKLFITNTIMRNSANLASPGNGRFVDTRGNLVDTVFVQNCTFYTSCSNAFRDGDGVIKYFFWDHVTLSQSGGAVSISKAVNASITNSLFLDVDFEGTVHSPGDPADTMWSEVIEIDTLNAPDLATEDQRSIVISNNSHAYSTAVQAHLDGIDSVKASVWFDQTGQYFVDTYTGIVAENNINEYPTFSDPPASDSILAWAIHRLETGFSNVGNPAIWADRNGIAALIDDPLSVGPAPDEYDFDYAHGDESFTHAEDNFPLGDLNWFPVQKAAWEAGSTAVGIADQIPAVPSRFSLAQNFPNPFNPSTTIAYSLNKAADVEMAVYNILGQKIRTLVNKNLQAGEYSAQWNGRNNEGNLVASGIYFYQLVAGDQIQVRKMLLMR